MEAVAVVDREFWRGRRVFLTGHTGFKGAWLATWLNSMGARVFGYALAPPTDPSMFEVLRLTELVEHATGDIRERGALTRAMSEFAPEVLFHLAAQPIVRESYLNPVDTYETNVMGMVNVLEAIRSVPSVRSAVMITTDKCYENREWPWGYREIEPMGGHDPYSSSKGCAELVISSYRRSFFDDGKVASARAGNVIGGGDWAKDRLIPDIVRSMLAGTPVTIRSPHAVRPWQHVLEPLSGYLRLAERLHTHGREYAEAWNFGPEDRDARSVEWIVRTVCELLPGSKGYTVDKGEHPHEAKYLKLDCSKARMRLDWHPRWTLEEALRRVVEWALACSAGEDLRNVTLDQIAAYEKAVTTA